MNGIFDPSNIAWLLDLIVRLKERGCDAVALACTELPLVIGDETSCLPTLDSKRLFARAALTCAVAPLHSEL